MNDVLLESHRSAAPAEADGAALGRVHDSARLIAGSRRPSRQWGRVVKTIAPLAAAAAVIGVAFAVMSPRVDDSAFARQQAVAALLPHAEVLHTKAYLEWGSNVVGTQRSYSEDWIDADRSLSRHEERVTGSDSVPGLSIRRGKIERGLGRDGGLDAKTGKVIPGSYRIVQYEAPVELTSPGGGYVEVLRRGLEDNKARVTDKVSFDGEEYWVVEMRMTSADKAVGESTEHVRATMRTSDYRLKTLTIRREGTHPVDGKWDETVNLEIVAWETVPRDSLPADFFDFECVDRAAPEGTIVEVPLDRTESSE
jgi:hypothetical protein